MGEYAMKGPRTGVAAPSRSPSFATRDSFASKPADSPLVPEEPKAAGRESQSAEGLVPVFPPGTIPAPTVPAGVRAANRTGLPDLLKAGVEQLSGLSLDGVRVHYGSPSPRRFAALAYTRGTEIHLAPGQERHLPHETWHVVQQMQGRVRPTGQIAGQGVNADPQLEREADDVAGDLAESGMKGRERRLAGAVAGAVPPPSEPTIQRKVGFEFETDIKVRKETKGSVANFTYKEPIDHSGAGWMVHADLNSHPSDEKKSQGVMEFVTSPLNDRGQVVGVMKEIGTYVQALEKSGRKDPTQKESKDSFVLRTEGDTQYLATTFEGTVGARPQVTFGVPFENIAPLLRRIKDSELVSYQDPTAPAKATRLLSEETPMPRGGKSEDESEQKVERGFDAITAGDRFAKAALARSDAAHGKDKKQEQDRGAGFVTLVVRYLYDIVSKAGINRVQYAKSALSILVRTDFHSMYKAQGSAIQQAFTPESIEEAAGLRSGALKAVNLYAGGLAETPDFEPFTAADWITSIRNPKVQVRDRSRVPGNKEAEKEKKRVGEVVRSASSFDARHVELKNLGDDEKQKFSNRLQNRDLLSRGGVAYDSNSMGAFLLGSEDTDIESKYPLLEFRELPGLAWPKWAEFALECFDLYAAEVKLEKDAKELAAKVDEPVAPAAPAAPASASASEVSLPASRSPAAEAPRADAQGVAAPARPGASWILLLRLIFLLELIRQLLQGGKD